MVNSWFCNRPHLSNQSEEKQKKTPMSISVPPMYIHTFLGTNTWTHTHMNAKKQINICQHFFNIIPRTLQASISMSYHYTSYVTVPWRNGRLSAGRSLGDHVSNGFTVSKKLEGRKRLANEIGAVLLHGSKGRQICCSAIGKTDCRPTLESPELLQTNVFTHI